MAHRKLLKKSKYIILESTSIWLIEGNFEIYLHNFHRLSIILHLPHFYHPVDMALPINTQKQTSFGHWMSELSSFLRICVSTRFKRRRPFIHGSERQILLIIMEWFNSFSYSWLSYSEIVDCIGGKSITVFFMKEDLNLKYSMPEYTWNSF